MKSKKQELDVDIIGSQEPLTADEEKALSDFFRNRKQEAKKVADEKRSATEKGSFRQAS